MSKPFDPVRFAKGLHDYIGQVVTPLVQRIAAVEQQSEPNLADAYRGVHTPGNTYARGSLVTHGGSLWLAIEKAEGTPGASPSWRLIVKRGKDGRDA